MFYTFYECRNKNQTARLFNSEPAHKKKLNDRYKFLISGGSNTALTYVIYVALVNVGINYNAALFIVYPIGIALGYIVNRCWTFANANAKKTATKSTRTQLFQYIGVYGLVFAVNLSCLNVFVRVFQLSPALAQFFAIGIATVCSYSLQKTWVFKS